MLYVIQPIQFAPAADEIDFTALNADETYLHDSGYEHREFTEEVAREILDDWLDVDDLDGDEVSRMRERSYLVWEIGCSQAAYHFHIECRVRALAGEACAVPRAAEDAVTEVGI